MLNKICTWKAKSAPSPQTARRKPHARALCHSFAVLRFYCFAESKQHIESGQIYINMDVLFIVIQYLISNSLTESIE
jgi:hypothetical protein